jgi:hypothetical protein
VTQTDPREDDEGTQPVVVDPDPDHAYEQVVNPDDPEGEGQPDRDSSNAQPVQHPPPSE